MVSTLSIVRRRPGIRICLAAALVPLSWTALVGSPQAAFGQPPPDVRVALEEVAGGLSQPVDIAFPDDGSGRMLVAEKTGRVRLVEGGMVRARPFLDLSARVSTNSERGLLGLAFDPLFRDNGFFYVHFTNTAGNSRVVRYRVSADPAVADPNSALTILGVAQFASNHNGGDLLFGPNDRMLYISLGDGGGGGDPQRHGQNRGSLLGTVLRIDVRAATPAAPYRIPPDNPFVGVAGARPEIWVYGLRNPWRISADRVRGDLFVADVGQNRFEEINFQLASSPGGENYGWNRMEGTACFPEGTSCDRSGLSLPILTYGRADGQSVTGGYRYRGQDHPALRGIYFYADFAAGGLFGATPEAGGWRSRQLLSTGFNPSTFGEDTRGELYVADFTGGRILRLRGPEGGGPSGCPLPPGHPRFCVDCGPCAAGQGDCDSDAECAAGAVCADNVGADFGFAPGIDVCVTPPAGCPWPVGHGRYCRDCGPCASGQGDCDSDAECQTGSTCVDNVGADFGFAPGVDVCIGGPPPPPPATCPLPPGHPDFCRDCGPCRVDQGDCDSDAECVPSARCAEDLGPSFGFGPRVDICVAR